MTTETKSHYTIDEVALWNAGINPNKCEGCVEFAAEDQLSGWELAVEYRDQLELEILNGEVIPSIDNTPVEHRVDDDQPTVSADTPIETFHQQFCLSFDDAQNWRPAGNPFKSEQPKTNKSNAEKPAAVSTFLMLAMAIEELGFYQKYNQQGRKGGQAATITHFQELARKYKIYQKFSKSTLQRNINAAKNAFAEHSNLSIEDK